MARRRRGKLPTGAGPERLPLLRGVRSSESCECLRPDECGEGWYGSGHAAVQAISRGENVVRAFLDAAAPRILAARTRREILPEIAGSDSLHLAARSDTVAAARGHSTA